MNKRSPILSNDATTDDAPLAEQLQLALREASHVRRYNFSVLELPHAVVIQGKVNSFFHKQIAQETAIRFLRPKQQNGKMVMLRNEIVVENDA
jgi:hypothetical protein